MPVTEDQQCHSGLRYPTLVSRMFSVFLILLPQMQTYLSPYSIDKCYKMFFYMEFGNQEMHSDLDDMLEVHCPTHNQT